ncbi:MAG: TolB family protein [Actinomycetota bacterium]
MPSVQRIRALLVVLSTAVLGLSAQPTQAVGIPGVQIVFESNRDGNFEIYRMNGDGTGQTRLTTNVAEDRNPKWSPNRNKIAFSSARDGNFEIYVMNPDGTGQTRLTTNTSSDRWPTWSPNGSKIAFSSARDGNFEIYVMNSDGTGQTRLTTNTAIDDHPAWSTGAVQGNGGEGNGGDRIAFTSTRDGNNEIYVMNTDGTGPTRLTNNPAFDFEPTWADHGASIFFASNRDGGDFDIFAMTSSGMNQTNLTPTSPAVDAAPGSCGGTITFQTIRTGNWNIGLMDLDGANPEVLPGSPLEEHKPDPLCPAPLPTFVNQLVVKEVGYRLGPYYLPPLAQSAEVDVYYQPLLHRGPSGPVIVTPFLLGPTNLPTGRWQRNDLVASTIDPTPHDVRISFELIFRSEVGGQTITYKNQSPVCMPAAGDSECRWSLAEGIDQICINTTCSSGDSISVGLACTTLPMLCQDGGQGWVRIGRIWNHSQLTLPVCQPSIATYGPGFENPVGPAQGPTANPPIVNVNRAGATQLRIHCQQTGFTVITVEVLNRNVVPARREVWAIGVTCVPAT